MTLGYVIVGVVLGGAVAMCAAIALVLWMAVGGARPDLMDPEPQGGAPIDHDALSKGNRHR